LAVGETERLTKALRNRIKAFERGDPGPITTEAAHEDAIRLIKATNQFDYDEQAKSVVLPASIAAMLGQYYWCRFLALGQPDDRQTAAALYGTAGLDLPDQLPPGRSLHKVASPAGQQNEILGWLDQATDLTEWVQTALGKVAREEALDRLDQAIALFERVRDVSSLEFRDIDMHLPPCLSNLAAARLLRYRLAREPDDLDQAIKSARAAVAMVPEKDSPRQAMYLSNLSEMLRSRYDMYGMLTDIDEAIDQQRIVLALTHPGDPKWIGRAGFLISLLNSRFTDTSDVRDIDEAISCGESLLAMPGQSAADHRQLLINAANLAASYVTLHHYRQRAGQEPEWTALDRAIELGEWVAGKLPDEDTGLPDVLSNLAEAMHQRSGAIGQGADAIQRAVDYAARAVAQTGLSEPRRAGFLINLGAASCDHARFGDGGVAAMRRAVAALAEAMAIPSAPARTRLYAARGCGECAGQVADWDTAIAAFWEALRLLPRIAWRGVDRATGERLLADADGLAGVAAAHAIMSGRLEEAVELLEFGRGVLWSQLLVGDMGQLRDIAPRLAQRLAEIDDELDWIENTGGASRDRRLADRQVRTARQRAELADQAQQVMAQQPTPPAAGFAYLCSAARNGPVVLINTSPWRCDALIVGRDGVRMLPLPKLKPEHIVDQIARFDVAMSKAMLSQSFAERDPSAEEELARILAWLWDTTVEPVLQALGYISSPTRGAAYPRVWWCPIGQLSFLPLHAAGYHASDHRDSALDRVVSSYAPNLHSLIAAKEQQWAPRSRDLLVVKTLDNKSPECWIPGYPTRVLSGAAASPEKVREALHSYAYVHVSTHGSQDVANPSAGHIKLIGGDLRLGDLRPGQYPAGRFAFLSACDTATGGTNLPDEMITLATAFQYAGFQHVIGTTRPVLDEVAIAVEQWVYAELVRDDVLEPEQAPAALRAAIAAQRDLAPGQPSRWLPFIHAGR
jgi:tetratricopeptide (TPR) repeat protein